VLDAVRGRLPERAAFAAGATLRFTPFFARELGELVEMQRLRGALLSVRQLARPSAWRDWLACVALPMTVRAIEIAEEAADAAAIRGLGEARNDPGKERK
jgi:energy-coupling factor transport system permease protein